MTPTETSRLITLVRRKNRPACLMLPGAGGGLRHYLRLASHLGGIYNVYGVRPSGLVAGEEPERTMAGMVDLVLRELNGADLVPELVFGWSLGGVVGWETCVRLAERGHFPKLVLVDSSPLARVSTVDEDRRIAEMIVGQLGPQAAAEPRKLVADLFQAQVGALAKYHVTGEYAGEVLLLRCAVPGAGISDDAVRRWAELAPAVKTGTLPGGHYDAFAPEQHEPLTAAVDDFLDITAKAGRVHRTEGSRPWC